MQRSHAIIEAVSKGEKEEDVAIHFNVPPSTLLRILKSKEDVLKAMLSGYMQPRENANGAVFKWFTDICMKDVPISGTILQ